MPKTERALLDSITDEIRRLDTTGGKIKSTVKNISIIDSIQKKLNRIILNDDYLRDVKDFAKGFNEITGLQNEYWKQAESKFKPRALLKALKVQAITNTVNDLAGQGIAQGISEPIKQILRTNITTGGSYADLTKELQTLITKNKTPGVVSKTIKQVALDSINQYSAQYNQVVSSDLGLTWYAWDGAEVYTSRPFCQAMNENHEFFHVSSIPNLLKGLDEYGQRLTYIDNVSNNQLDVTLYDKTNLPYGFIAGTNAENFLIRRGGYNCGHQPRAISEDLVKFQNPKLYEKIINSPTYKNYILSTGTFDKKFKTEKQIEKNLPAIKANKDGSLGHYKTSKASEPLTFIPEREQFHNTTVKNYIKEGLPKGGVNNNEIFLTGGAPANGKSTLLDSGLLPHNKKLLIVDPDKVKGTLPEYNQMVKNKDSQAAAAMHEESSYLGKKIINEAIEREFDFVVDGVGDGEYDSIVKKANLYRSTGKRVRADYVTLDTDLSLKLARARAAKTGREVPEEYILSMNKEIADLVPRMAKDGIYDELNLWDTNINGKPRLILQQIGNKIVIHDQKLYNEFLKKKDYVKK